MGVLFKLCQGLFFTFCLLSCQGALAGRKFSVALELYVKKTNSL